MTSKRKGLKANRAARPKPGSCSGPTMALGWLPVCGRAPSVSRWAEAIRHNRLEELLVFAEVKAGDVLYLPANTVHALGPGILVYEIQQSSDITYRLYDWGRLGLDGRPRELHIEKGVQVSNLNALAQVQRPLGDLVIDGDYFRTWRHELKNGRLTFSSEGRFQALTCISGRILVHADGHETYRAGAWRYRVDSGLFARRFARRQRCHLALFSALNLRLFP